MCGGRGQGNRGRGSCSGQAGRGVRATQTCAPHPSPTPRLPPQAQAVCAPQRARRARGAHRRLLLPAHAVRGARGGVGAEAGPGGGPRCCRHAACAARLTTPCRRLTSSRAFAPSPTTHPRRDELPFLIDLHLFLSRPLKPAPVQGIAEAAAAAAGLGHDCSVYGTFPQVRWGALVGRGGALGRGDAGLLRAAGPKPALYHPSPHHCNLPTRRRRWTTCWAACAACWPPRTTWSCSRRRATTPSACTARRGRPRRTRASSARARSLRWAHEAAGCGSRVASAAGVAGAAHGRSAVFTLRPRALPPSPHPPAPHPAAPPQEGIHPLLAAALPSDALGGLEAQTSLAEIAAKLKSYRPSQTVFEAEVAAARKGAGAGVMSMPGLVAAAPYERKMEARACCRPCCKPAASMLRMPPSPPSALHPAPPPRSPSPAEPILPSHLPPPAAGDAPEAAGAPIQNRCSQAARRGRRAGHRRHRRCGGAPAPPVPAAGRGGGGGGGRRGRQRGVGQG